MKEGRKALKKGYKEDLIEKSSHSDFGLGWHHCTNLQCDASYPCWSHKTRSDPKHLTSLFV